MKLQRLGGYAAFACVGAFMAYLALGILVQKRHGELNDPAKAMAEVSAAPGEFSILNLLMIFCFICLLAMVFALHARMQFNAPHLTRAMLISASAGTVMELTYRIILIVSIGTIVPSKDVSAYRAFLAMADGLHWAVGHIYGWVFLFMGCAFLKTRTFSKFLGWLILLTGVLWMLYFIVPQLSDAAHSLISVIGIWIGIELLRHKQPNRYQ